MRKDVIFAVLLTFCLTSMLFFVVPTRSIPADSKYDPWADMNDDGIIDMYDIGYPASLFLATGTPINKTALLLELQSEIEALNATIIEQQNTINNLNDTVTVLQNTTNYLDTTVDYLNTTVDFLNQTVTVLNSTRGLGAPDYDSGWVGISPGSSVTLAHNLNTTNLFVYLTAHSTGNYPSYPYAEHIAWLGGDHYKDQYNGLYELGAYWGTPDKDHITVTRVGGFGIEDPWETFRIRIWKIS